MYDSAMRWLLGATQLGFHGRISHPAIGTRAKESSSFFRWRANAWQLLVTAPRSIQYMEPEERVGMTARGGNRTDHKQRQKSQLCANKFYYVLRRVGKIKRLPQMWEILECGQK